MRTILFATLIALACSTPAFSATARWTGNQIPVSAATGYTVKCEYAQGAIKFWRLINGACPSTVEATSGTLPPGTGKRNQNQRILKQKTYP